MKQESILIGKIPCILWGEKNDKLYLFVHGMRSSKESASAFAAIAAPKGWQTLSFDLPAHGGRRDNPEPCNVWNGVRDVELVAAYAAERYGHVGLFGCSLGAYFSLMSRFPMTLEKALFQSPIVDMEHLIGKMMVWFNVPEERLEREKAVPTPIDTLSWEYYQFVKAHPVTAWKPPTAILYGSLDNLQDQAVMEAFADKFGCALTISQGSEHPFAGESDGDVVHRWLEATI